jgi:bacterioferritin
VALLSLSLLDIKAKGDRLNVGEKGLFVYGAELGFKVGFRPQSLPRRKNMASKELQDKLNQAIAMELQVSVQYIWQHVTITGINAESVGGVFKKIAITEMKHAEAIAERLDYLGGKLTTKPNPIVVGNGVKDMLQLDKKAEEGTIKLYKEIVALAAKEKDIVTKKLFEEILSDEEEHHNQFSTLLEG